MAAFSNVLSAYGNRTLVALSISLNVTEESVSVPMNVTLLNPKYAAVVESYNFEVTDDSPGTITGLWLPERFSCAEMTQTEPKMSTTSECCPWTSQPYLRHELGLLGQMLNACRLDCGRQLAS